MIPMRHIRTQLLDQTPRRPDSFGDEQRRVPVVVSDVYVPAVGANEGAEE